MVTRDDTLSVGAHEPKIGGTASASGLAGARRRHRVHAPHRWYDVHVGELWAYRHVISHFGWSFVTRRFRGMWLGWLWLPLRPTVQLLQRGLVFGAMLKVGSGDRPYIIFLLVGQAAWDFFDRAAFFSLRSIKYAKQLQRVRLPWATAAIATIIPGIVDAAFYVVVAAIVCTYYKLTQGSFYITLGPSTPGVLLGLLLLTAWIVAVGCLIAPLVYKIPDARYILRYFFGFLIYLTPVIYPTSSLKGFQALATYNPLTAPIELIKNGLLETGAPAAGSMLACVIGLAVMLPLGLLVIARTQRTANAQL
jgi:lipopolysaccharide transport system permease protein